MTHMPATLWCISTHICLGNKNAPDHLQLIIDCLSNPSCSLHWPEANTPETQSPLRIDHVVIAWTYHTNPSRVNNEHRYLTVSLIYPLAAWRGDNMERCPSSDSWQGDRKNLIIQFVSIQIVAFKSILQGSILAAHVVLNTKPYTLNLPNPKTLRNHGQLRICSQSAQHSRVL
jgi:hypothetical protein